MSQITKLNLTGVNLPTGAEVVRPQDGGQTNFLSRSEDEVLYGGAAGPGKAQPLYSKVLTPSGFVTMGEIKVNDYVVTPENKFVKVLQIHPQEGAQQIYELTFIDGAKTRATAQHLWNVDIARSRTKNKLVTTEFLHEHFNQNKKSNILIPLSDPIEFEKKELLIDPYVLGLILGDGCLKKRSWTYFTTADAEIIDKIIEKGYAVNKLKSKYGFSILKVYSLITKLGLAYKGSNDKFIPKEYIYSSIADRWAIIQGLMDTDGSADEKGYCEYVTISKQLALDFQEIIWSLGGKATIKEKVTKRQLAYRLYIKTKTNTNLFQLSRKKARAIDSYNNGSVLKRRLIAVEKLGLEPAKCITIDSRDGLYITDNYIVTHNSWALIIDALGLQYQFTPLGKPAVEVQNYRAVLFRRESVQLGDLIDKAHAYYTNAPFHATYVAQKKGAPGPLFLFPSGAIIYFCHLESENDKHKHDGFAYQYIGFDELTQFLVTQYLHLFTRGRSTIPFLGVRIRSTTNPIGRGLPWVKKRFIKTGSKIFTPKVTYYFIKDVENPPEINPTGIQVPKGTPHSMSRTFVPGLLDENRILMDNDPAYEDKISAGGSKVEKALRRGDWDAFGGTFFDDFDTSTMAVDPFQIPEEWTLIGAIDPGWSSPCSFGLKAMDYKGNVYRLFTYYVRNQSPQYHAQEIRERIKGFKYTGGRWPLNILAGRDAWAKKDRNAIMAHELTFADIFREAGIYLVHGDDKSRAVGWWATKSLMREGRYFYFKGFNEPYVEEVVSAEADENDIEDIRGKGNDGEVMDHALDEDKMSNLALYKPVDEFDDAPQWLKDLRARRKNKSSHGTKTGYMGN